jgi:hypothetical protein
MSSIKVKASYGDDRHQEEKIGGKESKRKRDVACLLVLLGRGGQVGTYYVLCIVQYLGYCIVPLPTSLTYLGA